MPHIMARIKPVSSSAANCIFHATCACVSRVEIETVASQPFESEILPSEFVSNKHFLFSELWGFRMYSEEGIVNLDTKLRHIIKGPI